MYIKTALSRLCTFAQRNFHTCHGSGNFVMANRNMLLSTYFRCLCQKTPEDSQSERVLDERKTLEDTSTHVTKYKPFRDQDATIIFDVEEERLLKQELIANEEEVDEFESLLQDRGDQRVFTPEELVNILLSQKAKNIVVVGIPSTFDYVDEMIIVTGKSKKHMFGMAEFVRKAFKRKRMENEKIPKIEGSKTSEWIALDLGNIALHIFSEDTRGIYDLEALWAVGPEFDSQLNRPKADSLVEAVNMHSIHLSDLQPAKATTEGQIN